MISFLVRQGAVAARPRIARTLYTTARVYKDDVPAPVAPERDLDREQVDRIGEPAPMAIVSDAPKSLHQRTVRIYRPAKSANSSGRAGTMYWQVDFDVLQESGRWESPLMGWASTADSQQALLMKFDSKEDAMHFCEKQGWDYVLQEPHTARIGPKVYADNFKYVPNKLRIHHTK
ncbi:ndufs4 NADH dehydrogenase Fe-S protein subunit [Malassezia sp. CBS 17886]|nr:ndufs4 NADH dehydrogenase Fe-S protein subunit [Malassezia sp. CBS 17886]